MKESEQDIYYDTKLCPTDPRLISFIRNDDIYVTSNHVTDLIRLTESPNPAGRGCNVSKLYNTFYYIINLRM